MGSLSVDIPAPSLDGEWTAEAAADAVGKQLRLRLGDTDTTALVVGAHAAEDGLSLHLDLETDAPIPEGYTVRIDVEGD
ncbi:MULTISPECIES: hypothetical protein [unclassified Streptomyces]|uniref:hypothetical protein n=1 Tax=unclassified Streptomyces TaxID=2593676 RepID=UPI00382FD081